MPNPPFADSITAKLNITSWFWSLLMVLITTAIYSQVAQFDFLNLDDEPYILINSHVNTGFSVENISWAFNEYYTANWHPLTWLSHMLDIQLYGLNAGGHHISSLILHLGNSFLLLILLQKIGFKPILAISMALLFAVHPSHVESVVWIAERKDVLSTLFLLLTLIAYLHYKQSPSLVRYFIVFVSLTLGLLSKSMLMTLPFVMMLLDYYPVNKIWPADENFKLSRVAKQIAYSFAEKIPFFLLVAIVLVSVYRAQDAGGAMNSLAALGLDDRIGNAVVAYSHYVKAAVLPAKLAVFYPHPGSWPLQQILISSVFLLSTTTLVIWQMRARPYLFVGWFWFLGTLVPVIGLLQIGAQYMADRYTYVPFIGLFIALVPLCYESLHKVENGQRYYNVFGCLIVAFYALVSFQYISHWRNSITLYTHTLYTIDDSYAYRLGVKKKPAAEIAEPVPGSSIIYFNLGNALAAEGQFDIAVAHYRLALRIVPHQPPGMNNMALMLAAQGKTDEAMEVLKQLVARSPGYELGQNNLIRIKNGWQPGSIEWNTLGKATSMKANTAAEN